jgi:hypothetical protein
MRAHQTCPLRLLPAPQPRPGPSRPSVARPETSLPLRRRSPRRLQRLPMAPPARRRRNPTPHAKPTSWTARLTASGASGSRSGGPLVRSGRRARCRRHASGQNGRGAGEQAKAARGSRSQGPHGQGMENRSRRGFGKSPLHPCRCQGSRRGSSPPQPRLWPARHKSSNAPLRTGRSLGRSGRW